MIHPTDKSDWYSHRKTNKLEIRNQLKEYIPVGSKSDIICKPINISEIDYWRGVIDGDGSLGITANNIPFLSLVTKSTNLANEFVDFIEKMCGFRKKTSKNKRDSAYNICVTNETAQKIINVLYYNNCLCIERKRNKSNEVIEWKRPDNRRKVMWDKKKWTDEEDSFIMENDLYTSIEKLGRTKKSIEIRMFRLKSH